MFAGGGTRTRRRGSYVGTGRTLARFSGGAIDHPTLFGGGHPSALVGLREQTIAYGYAAVLEQFETSFGARWCTLSVSLPNSLPWLVIDAVGGLGSPDVPPSRGVRVVTGDREFDSAYAVTAEDEDAAGYLLGPELREVLLCRPVQRMSFVGTRMLVRAFDAPDVDNAVVDWMHQNAVQILRAVPGFLSPLRGTWTTFPPGITGPRV